MALKYRIKQEFQGTKKIVVVNDRGYMIDNDFVANNPNANELIEGHKIIGERFETIEGKSLEFKEEPKKQAPKVEKPRGTKKKRTTKAAK